MTLVLAWQLIITDVLKVLKIPGDSTQAAQFTNQSRKIFQKSLFLQKKIAWYTCV